MDLTSDHERHAPVHTFLARARAILLGGGPEASARTRLSNAAMRMLADVNKWERVLSAKRLAALKEVLRRHHWSPQTYVFERLPSPAAFMADAGAFVTRAEARWVREGSRHKRFSSA